MAGICLQQADRQTVSQYYSTVLPIVSKFPKEHCFSEDSQASPVRPSGKSNV
jgi:hypothetical protein